MSSKVSNRSVPVDTLLPHITYEDVGGAVKWLAEAFGFAEHYRYGPPDAPEGAQMHLGDVWIMLNRARAGRTSPRHAGNYTQCLTVFVEDVDAHYEQAKRAGARVVEELQETKYGERQYGAEDHEGHLWIFSRHARDLSPQEWGATVALG
jgi:uncharacterized glyoxalase superfamily protein PhnB